MVRGSVLLRLSKDDPVLNHQQQKLPAPPSVDSLEELADDDILEVDGQPSFVPSAPSIVAPPDSLDIFDKLPPKHAPITKPSLLMTKTALGLPPAPGPIPQAQPEPEPEIAIEEDSLEVFDRAAANFPAASHELPVSAIAMTMKVQNDPRPAPEPDQKVIVHEADEAERRSEAPVDRTLRIARADMAMAGQILAAVDGPPSAGRPMYQSNIPSTTIRTSAVPAPVIPPAPITSPVLSSNIPTIMGGVSPVPPSVRASVPDHHGMPLSQVPTQGVRPQQSSIAPVAVDVRQSAAAIALPPPSRVPVIAPPPQPKSNAPWIATAIAAALFLGVGGVIAGFAIGSSGSSQAATSTTTTNEAKVAKAAHTPVVESANGASIDTTPRTAPARDSSQPSEIDVSSLPSAVTPTPGAAKVAANAPATTTTTTTTTSASPVTTTATTATATSQGGGGSSFAAKAREQATQKDEKKDPPAPPPVVAAPAPQPAGPAPTTGVVRVPIDDRFVTIMVDGGYRKVNNGQVVVSCGRHSVRVGMGSTQDVNVPCGGSVFVQN